VRLGKLGEKWVVFWATGCYAGYLPGAPGTYGTLVAIPVCYLLSRLGLLTGIVFIGTFVGVAVWVSNEAETIFRKKDSPLIVVDEMAGFLVTLFLIPWSAKSLVTGFVVFRIFDIVKPFPIRRLESQLPGGWGVVADDVFAGFYANVISRVIIGFL
jgi:phosphatidylglycerophosphatase A